MMGASSLHAISWEADIQSILKLFKYLEFHGDKGSLAVLWLITDTENDCILGSHPGN